MKVFITDAVGYIGFNVAVSFRQAGFKVFGLVAGEEKAALLARHEIIPLVGSLRKPKHFKDIAARSVVIIHSAMINHPEGESLDREAIQALLAACKNEPPKTLIYTSSLWVLGNSKNRPLTEQSPCNPAEAVAWLPEIEALVLNNQVSGGLVIRPGIVYGQGGGLTGTWFRRASSDSFVQIVGDGLNHWAMVHIDDLAQGILKAARSGLGGEVFNLAEPKHHIVMKLASAAALAAGSDRQLEFIPLDKASREIGRLAEALALDQIVDVSKARDVLGWQSRHEGFISETDVYYRAWRALNS